MQTPFELFDLPVQFALDLTALSQRYLALQKALHPDNFSSESEQQQRLALQKSAQINDAYQLLKDPISRAEAMLNIALAQQSNPETTMQDMTFLMQQMQWREELESIEQQLDEKSGILLENLQDEVSAEQERLLTELATLIEQQQWSEVKSIIDRLKFIRKLQQEIARLDEKLFGL